LVEEIRKFAQKNKEEISNNLTLKDINLKKDEEI
jgi:hypothetical protein